MYSNIIPFQVSAVILYLSHMCAHDNMFIMDLGLYHTGKNCGKSPIILESCLPSFVYAFSVFPLVLIFNNFLGLLKTENVEPVSIRIEVLPYFFAAFLYFDICAQEKCTMIDSSESVSLSYPTCTCCSSSSVSS